MLLQRAWGSVTNLCSYLARLLPSRLKLGLLLCIGLFVLGIVLVERGLYGKYCLGYQSLLIVLIITTPSFAYCGIVQLWNYTYQGSSRECFISTPWKKKQHILGFLFVFGCSLVTCAWYLSSKGLWCVYLERHHRVICHTACMLQRTLQIKGIPVWLTLGDLLASHRKRTMPFRWEHDIDLCISKDHFQTSFTEEIRRGVFRPPPIWIKPNHVYFEPVAVRPREAEGLIVDVWECDPVFYGATEEERKLGLNGTFTMVPFCGCEFAAPKMEHRDRIFKKFYGANYTVQKFDHHAWQCNLWIDY